MQRLLLITAAVCVILAILWPLIQKSGLGRLPGDFVFGKGSFKVYLPLTTSILISIVITLILWFFRK